MKELALSIPGYNIQAPGGIPTGGIGTGAVIIKTGVTLLLLGSTILCLFYIIYGGIKWLMSSGDQEKLAVARLTIMYAIIGLCLCFFSFLIIHVLSDFFGFNLLMF